MKEINGNLIVSKEQRFSIIVSRFNDFLSKKLLEGAVDCLKRHGAAEDQIDVVWVPGAYEISYAAARLVGKNYGAVICLGVVLKGETTHNEYINQQAARNIANLSIQSGVPVIYGIVTADDLEQAINRCGAKSGNKGWQASLTAIEMANLFKTL